jgi:signal transduction histidine kinase
MYTQLQSFVGEGVVGGAVTRFDHEGAQTARLVAGVLRQPPSAAMPPIESIDLSFVVDWRQLQKWSLSESLLYPGTQVLFRELTLWQRYRTSVLLTLAIILAESMLIAALLVERRRRKLAQRRADEARRQVAHMGRLAVVGELVATISHEIRQPLTAIRTNAETGVKVIGRVDGTMSIDQRLLCQDILSDIVADNPRASEIITRVLALARREEPGERSVDLNEVCRTAIRLLQHDEQARRADLVLVLDPRLKPMFGDAVQFQQVVLNLVLNALDSCSLEPSPRVTIATVDQETEVELSVTDNGLGIPAHVHARLFESFFTTKPDGLGLGLSIVESIVERHRGRVSAENTPGGGARFRVLLPKIDQPVSIIEGGANSSPVATPPSAQVAITG